tara:strand:- start:282 stop:812 length:531 start_codon:yes stop_codon:yes gene_type:complete
MKKLIFILIVGSLFMGCAFEDSKKISETDLLHKADPDGNYGNEITLEVKHPIGKLLGSPQIYLEKEVLVSGEITEVCPMRGCWINVKDSETDANLRIKVTDGKIVFPLSAKGKHVDVQGRFTKLDYTELQAKKWKIHLAKEQGITLNPEDINITPEDLVEYRINGTGANIYSYGCK